MQTEIQSESPPRPAAPVELKDQRLRGTYLASLPVLFPDKESFYNVSVIPKKSGGKRIIEAPVEWLKKAQRAVYAQVLLPTCKVGKRAYGCIKRRNITGCATHHVGKTTVLKIDLKDCFHTIHSDKILETLRGYAIPEPVVQKIVYLCTNSRGVLPQGSPASPSLANIVMIKMYKAVQTLAERMDLEFSGYLDDLIFSGEKACRALAPARKIIEFYGFRCSPSKISYMRRKREVLGLCVAPGKEHTRLPKKLRNSIRGYLHCIERDLAQRKLNRKFFGHVAGLAAFSVQANDQKGTVFQSQVQALRQKIKALQSGPGIIEI